MSPAKCPDCGTYVGLLESLPPYLVHMETWGVGFGDLAFWMGDFLVSRKFRDEYLQSGLKGLSQFDAVSILSHKKFGTVKGRPPEYFRTIPQIGAARIDVVASGIEWGGNKRPTCKRCLSGGGVRERWQRVMVDESSWNGDDVFYAYGLPGSLLVSPRFFEWAKPLNFRNLIMIPSNESSHDFYPGRTGKCGRDL